jgi:hypothetical protein
LLLLLGLCFLVGWLVGCCWGVWHWNCSRCIGEGDENCRGALLAGDESTLTGIGVTGVEGRFDFCEKENELLLLWVL